MIGLLALVAAQVAATPPLPVAEPFAPMRFLIGHCWAGEFRPGVTDTHCFESVYGGRFIRDRHEVTGGYSGESLYAWSDEAGRVEYVYWNSQGGVSRGGMSPHDNLLDFGSEVHRRADGSEVRFSTTWRQVDANSYEVVAGPEGGPTGRRTIRYMRTDAAPVAIRTEPGEGGTTTLIHEAVLPAPPQQLYGLFATVEGWRRWAVPNAWTDPADPDVMETSYDRAAAIGAPQNIRQRFLLRVPSRLVAWRTIRTPQGFPHAEAFMRTTQMIELIPEGSSTRVRLTGQGYPAGAEGEALLAFFREGNRTTLENLRRVVASRPN